MSNISIEYVFEGEFRAVKGRWEPIETRSDLETAMKDEADYRTWIDESGWSDFRIVKKTVTREILSGCKTPHYIYVPDGELPILLDSPKTRIRGIEFV